MKSAIILFVVLAITFAFVNGHDNQRLVKRFHTRDSTNGTSGGGGATNGTSTPPTTPSGGNGTTPSGTTPSGNGTTPSGTTPSGNGTTPSGTTPSGNGTTPSGTTPSSGNGTTSESTPNPQKELFYNGGPLMTNPIGIHFIFYGNDDTFYETLKTTYKAFISDGNGFGGSAYYDITHTQLVDGTGTGPSNQITWAGEWKAPTEKYGTELTVADDNFLVKEYANTTGITLNSNDHYMVFIGDGVKFNAGSFKDTCGYHTFADIPGGSGVYVYSLVSSTSDSNAGGSCAPLNGPNGALVDGSIATAVHEIIEAASDPQPADGTTGWRAKVFGQPNENADNCDGYGNQQPLASDSSKMWNIQIGSGFYLIAGNWDNKQLICQNPLN